MIYAEKFFSLKKICRKYGITRCPQRRITAAARDKLCSSDMFYNKYPEEFDLVLKSYINTKITNYRKIPQKMIILKEYIKLLNYL